MSKNRSCEAFDVSAALPSRMPTAMSTCGLPAVGTFPKVRPGKLLQILNGAHGLTEAPRLWYLHARKRLAKPVFLTELRCARSVPVKHDAGRKLRLFLTLHLNGGFLFGTRSDPIYGRVKELINTQFDTEDWRDLDNLRRLRLP